MTPGTLPNRLSLSLLAGAIALALAGCGGGGGSDATDTTQAAGGGAAGTPTAPSTPTTPDAPAVAAVTLSGVAATGAPMAGATVKVYDATGAVACTQTTDADGAYRCDLGIAPKPPFVVEASLGETRLMSAFAEAKSSTVNITPVTHLIASTLAPDGNPDSLLAAPANVDARRLAEAVAKVVEALKPLTEALGASIDPITGRFAADGTGHDKVLDALQISVRPNGTTASIEITVRAPAAEGAAPPRIAFEANAAALPPLPRGIELGDMGRSNVKALIDEFVARATACYALPVAQRVTDGERDGSTVKAPQCRSLFLDDDPANWLHMGGRVGPNRAWAGLFRESSTGVQWRTGGVDFFRPNGDWVIQYKVGREGNFTTDQLVVRNVGGTLKAVGNQFRYSSYVRAFTQLRDHLNQPLASNLTVGYNVQIANVLDSGGNPIFEKVAVTAPGGRVFTYRPNGNLSWLTVDRADGSQSPSPVLRLRGRFVDPANTATLSRVEDSLVFPDPSITDGDIAQLPDQGLWAFEFFHTDPAVPNVVQKFRTVSRASTLAEAWQKRFATVTPPVRQSLIDETAARGVAVFDTAPTAENPNHVDLTWPDGGGFWQVPRNALSPTSINVFGRAPAPAQGVLGARYNDGMTVAPSARGVLIRCQPASPSDAHCDPTLRSSFALGSTINALEFWAKDERQREFSTLAALYRLNLQPAQ